MARKRKTYSTQFKFNVVVECIKNGNVVESARQYNLHPNLLTRWKQDFLENGHKLFETDKCDNEIKYKKNIEQYEKLLGKKELEINLLKGFLDHYAPINI